MSNKLSLYFAVSSLIIWNAQASDDIQVDLSVLDNIPQDSIGFVSSQPLFPVIKATPSHKKSVSSSPKKIQKKIKIKKPEPVKPQVVQKVESKPTLSPVVKKIEPKAIQPEEKVENPFAKEEYAPLNAERTKPVEPVSDRGFVSAQKEETRKRMETSSEAKFETNDRDSYVESEEPKENFVETAQTPQKEETTTPVLPASQMNLDETDPRDKVLGEPHNLLSQSPIQQQTEATPEPEILSAKVSAQDGVETSATTEQLKEIFSISFAPESTELSAEAQAKLEKVAQKLNKEDKKKIYIKSYNYDGGKNVFRKKRICLNRATAVRSYLLNHGFKNFSIKIININMPNEYVDTVEIEEMN